MGDRKSMKNLLKTSLCTLSLTLIANSARSQITPDGSLPTSVNQQGNVTEITGGEQAGSNLFHSFQDFSVATGNEAFFNNKINIDNILSRVTGGNISDIDGLVRANGTANLFLINPAGIIFGNNARLELGGSFFGSTATGISFEDGTEFRSTNTGTPILTINAPIGLNLRETTGNISSTANLQSDRSLTLSGNNLNLQGLLKAGENLTLEASNTITARDSVTNPFIASAGQELSLQGGIIDLFILNNPSSGLFSGGNQILRSDNPINGDAHYQSGGSFRLEQLDGSLGDLISLEDPVIQSEADVSLASYEGASLHVQSAGNVTIDGDVNITRADTTENSVQETVTLSNGSQVNINGNAEPTLDIRAGTNRVDTPVKSGSNIDINGTVNNSGGKVFLTNQYQPNTDLAAGDISVTAINTNNPSGNGGDVTIDSRNNINISDVINTSSIADAQLTTDANIQEFDQVTIASGNGGAIALLADNAIATGNLNASSQVNLNLNTEVDTIEEANTPFAIPQATVQANAGGDVNLGAKNNLDIGTINSSSAIAINSDSRAANNFSLVRANLGLNTANGGQINLDAGNNLTTDNISSNASVSDRLTSNAETTPEAISSVSQVALNITEADIGSGGNIFLQAGKNVNTGSLNSSVALSNIFNNTATVLPNNPQAINLERPPRAVSQVQVSYGNLTIGSGGVIRVDAGDSITTQELNSRVLVTDNIVNVETTPNLIPSITNVALNVSNATIASGGDIFLQGQENINTGSLNSSVLVSNDSLNQALVNANNPNVTTDEGTPDSANELQIEVTYGIFNLDGSPQEAPVSEITLGKGGTITVESDRATVGDVNSSIGVNSSNTVFARVDVANDAVANSFANSRILLNVVGDRPGNISFEQTDIQDIGKLNFAASTNAANNLDSVAFANGENLANANDSVNRSNAFANGKNIIIFDSAINKALIAFDLNVPDVDYVIYRANNIPSNNIQPVAFNMFDTCPVNVDTVNLEPQGIETSQGKIYPAQGITMKNGQIRLTAKPTGRISNRTPVKFKGCN
jgi:filamentous hemagglutinin family protein